MHCQWQQSGVALNTCRPDQKFAPVKNEQFSESSFQLRNHEPHAWGCRHSPTGNTDGPCSSWLDEHYRKMSETTAAKRLANSVLCNDNLLFF